MKKVLLVLAAALTSLTLAAEANFGFWMDAPKGNSSTSVKGVSFGLPISNIKNIKGAQISIFCSFAKDAKGFQGAIGMNKAKEFDAGCQLAAVNFADELDDSAVQVGAYNQSRKDGIQVGFVNNCRNSAKVQVGFVNINKNGLFPVMIFVNFDKDLFD